MPQSNKQQEGYGDGCDDRVDAALVTVPGGKITIGEMQGRQKTCNQQKIERPAPRADIFVRRIHGCDPQGGIKGDVPYGTLTTIDESPLKFGLIYAGSDDGLVHVTKDGGNSWKEISSGFPQDLWVSRVDASSHDESTVYVSLNGYRWDNDIHLPEEQSLRLFLNGCHHIWVAMPR